MVHNGIEYGLMQAYAEGFDILRGATSKELPIEIQYDIPLPEVAELWRRGSVVGSWLLDLTAMALIENSRSVELHRLRPRFRRRPLDDRGGAAGSRAGRGAHRRALHPVPFAPAAYLRGKNAFGHAPEIRRPCRTTDPKTEGQVHA
jgi:6-phosphogluconate dehydrogenase